MNGTASLTGENGALAGLDVEQLLRRLERRPLSGGGDFRTGRTPYDKIAVALKIAQGKVTVEDVKIDGPGGAAGARRLRLDPGARTRSQRHRRAGVAGQAGRRRRSNCRSSCRAPGTTRSCCPTPEALIRRSGAAAPLLNAVRDRSARDAARSVIERLTGAPRAGRPGRRAVRRRRRKSPNNAARAGRRARVAWSAISTIIAPETNHPPACAAGDERARMLHPILRTLVKVAVASLVVGTILAHFGITAEQLMREFGLSADRIEDYASRALPGPGRTCCWARW